MMKLAKLAIQGSDMPVTTLTLDTFCGGGSFFVFVSDVTG